MNTATKLSAYGAALVLVAGGAWAIGSAVGPLSDNTAEKTAAPAKAAGHGDTHSDTVAETGHAEALPAGLASSMGG